MTADEFNEKYRDYLENDHYGLDIHIPEIIDYLDKAFPQIIEQHPNFKYSQIKLKFDMARFYCEPREVNNQLIEMEIEEIIKGLKS